MLDYPYTLVSYDGYKTVLVDIKGEQFKFSTASVKPFHSVHDPPDKDDTKSSIPTLQEENKSSNSATSDSPPSPTAGLKEPSGNKISFSDTDDIIPDSSS